MSNSSKIIRFKHIFSILHIIYSFYLIKILFFILLALGLTWTLKTIWVVEKNISLEYDLDAQNKIDLLMNNCQVVFETSETISNPKVQFKLFKNSGMFEEADSPICVEKDNQKYVLFYSNNSIKNCLVRFLIPVNLKVISDMSIDCRNNCAIKSLLTTRLVIENLTIISKQIEVALENVTVNKMVVDSDFISFYLKNFKLLTSFIYAQTCIFDLLLDAMDSFSFYSLSNIEIENYINVQNTTSLFPFQNLRSVCSSSKTELKLYDYITDTFGSDKLNKIWPCEVYIKVPGIFYNEKNATAIPQHVFYIQHLAISIKGMPSLDIQDLPEILSENNTANYASMLIIPPVQEKIRSVIKEFSTDSSYVSYVFNIKFLNLLTKSSENLIGAYFSAGIDRYAVTAFLDVNNPVQIDHNKIYYIEVAVFYPYVVRNQAEESILLVTLRQYLCDKITDVLESEKIIETPSANQQRTSKFYILNPDPA